MMEQEVVDYILQAQKHGLSDFEIKQNLLNVGWEAGTVEDSLVFVKASESKTMASMQDTHKPAPVSPITPGLSSIPPVFNQTMPPVSSPTPVMTDLQFEHPTASSGSVFKKPLLWVIIIILLLLGGGAYAYFGYFSITPQSVINKYLTSSKATTFNTGYSISYSDNSSASTTGNIGFTLSGTLNSDLSNLQNIKQANNLNASVTYGITNFGINFKYLLLGQVLYFDIGQIPQLKSFLTDQNIEWVKIDSTELKKQQDPSTSEIFNQLSLSPQVQNQLKDIWSKANVLKPDGKLTRENLNGVSVYHLKENFDNQAFANAVVSSIQLIAKQSTSTAVTLTDSDKKLITALINKAKVSELDIWIGQKDSQIYKFHLLMSAPSVKDLSDPTFIDNAPGLGNARAKSDDAKRLADARQSASALELYYNDYGGYPSVSNGVPQNLTPTYIGLWPTAPQPGGTCTDYYNTYWYSPQGTPYKVRGITVYPSYTLTFCLGDITGGYKAGIAELTPGGIKDNIPCPTTAAQCVNSNQVDNSRQISDAINKMTFGAQLKIDATYSDYGKPQNISAPTSSTDILDIIKQMSAGTVSSSTPSSY